MAEWSLDQVAYGDTEMSLEKAMADYMRAKLSCSCWQEVVGAGNALVTELPTDARNRFNSIFSDYLHRYGLEGVFERLNNRNIATIFEEYEAENKKEPIESGELDGIRYELFEGPEECEKE